MNIPERFLYKLAEGMLMRMKGYLMMKCWAIVLIALVGSGSAFGAARAVDWTLQESKVEANPGQTIHLHLLGKIPPGVHTYSLKEYPSATSLKAGPPELLTLAAGVTYSPPPKQVKDKEGQDAEEFENEVTFDVPVVVSGDAKSGTHQPFIEVTAMVCNDKFCFPPRDAHFDFELFIKDGPKVATVPPPPVIKSAKPTGPGGDAETLNTINRARKDGLLSYLSVAFAAGATALLTPCVFPMIPITVSFFTKRKQGSRGRALRDAGVYSLGIIFTFIGLGFMFALLMGASGINRFAANPWINLVIAAVFVLLALSLFGVYEIQIPSGLLTRLNNSASQGEGIGSVLLMGLVFSLTSFTCTVPFVGAVMVSATQGDWLWPFLGMLVFSSVFASPFFLLALFPAALKSLPKSGGWLNSVKVIMGFLEIAAAVKFLSNADLVWHLGVLTRPVFLFVWIAISVLTVLYLMGTIKFAHDAPVKQRSYVRLLSASGFASVAVFLTTGLFGAPLSVLSPFVPPLHYPGSNETTADGLTWYTDLDQALAESKRTGLPVFMDFTGHTCTNCRDMESNVFPQPQVVEQLKKCIRVRLFTDDAIEKARSLKYQDLMDKHFSTVTLPLYSLAVPDASNPDQFADIAPHFEGSTGDVQQYVNFLKEALSKVPPVVKQ